MPSQIVSPYARAGYTDSSPATFVSMLAYAEHNFGLVPLNSSDAKAYDYADAFDYSQSPLAPARMVHTAIRPSVRRAIERHPFSEDGAT